MKNQYVHVILEHKSKVLYKKKKNVKLCVQSEWKVLHVDSHFVPVGCQLKKPIRGVNQIFENP